MQICLVMIVKNEAHVLRRALDSVKYMIDYAMIVDTGSHEEQKIYMENVVEDIFIKDPSVSADALFTDDDWQDFAHNRTNAMRLAEHIFPDATHLLMLDADDFVESKTYPTELPEDVDAFQATMRGDTIEYPRLQLFKAHVGWYYRGVVHEFPVLPPGVEAKTATVPLVIRSTREGARNIDSKAKYLSDAQLMTAALERGWIEVELQARYQFYIAQSYYDAGDLSRAVHWYELRSDNTEGYAEERYVSLLRLMRIRAATVTNVAERCYAIEGYARLAQALCPHRREAVCYAMKYLNEAKEHKRALTLWRTHPVFRQPTGLFVEPAVYQWKMYEEAGIAAYYCDEIRFSVTMFKHALEGYPDKSVDMTRLVRNTAFALSAL